MVAFLMLMVLLSYLMIATTTEEKENRVAEILLTATKGTTIILGKIMSIFILGGVQLVVLIVPLVILYLKFRNQINLPGGITLSNIPLNPAQITIGVLGARNRPGLIHWNTRRSRRPHSERTRRREIPWSDDHMGISANLYDWVYSDFSTSPRRTGFHLLSPVRTNNDYA